MGLISSSGKAQQQKDSSQATMSSQLAHDLKEQGIECIEKVPQIAQVREAQSLFDSVSPILEQDHLKQNIGFLLEPKTCTAEEATLSNTTNGSQ